MNRLVSQGLFAVGAMSADQALESALDGGLLRVLPGSGIVALVHDLFCDFFASEAVRVGQRELPDALGESLEELAVFLAERGDMPLGLAQRVVTSPVAAARCADAMSLTGCPDEQDVTALYAELRKHLGDARQAALADVRVRAADLADGVYLFVLPDEESPTGRPIDWRVASEHALRAARIPRGSTSLAAAVALWLTDLRLALGETDRGRLLAIPRDREDLPDVLIRAFTERSESLEELCTSACPTLRGRVLRHLNIRGFHAVVLPAQTERLPVGGGQELTTHPVAISFNASDVAVRLADVVDEDFIEEPWTRMAAEDWLRDAPLQGALNDVRRILTVLLPGFAR